MTQLHVDFDSAGLSLEGILHLPQASGPFPAVAVCHPHPLYGGDMHNNVVLAICSALAKTAVAALRFNFRGVGRSRGEHADGVGEQEDVASALAFMKSVEGIDLHRIGLAGYSFGSRVAAPVALRQQDVKALALVSPFLTPSDWEELNAYPVPKLFLCGSEDNFISCQEVKRMVDGLPEPRQFGMVMGADHFWWGFEGEIASRVAAFFEAAL